MRLERVRAEGACELEDGYRQEIVYPDDRDHGLHEEPFGALLLYDMDYTDGRCRRCYGCQNEVHRPSPGGIELEGIERLKHGEHREEGHRGLAQ